MTERCAEEHDQLAELLEELKFLRQWKNDVVEAFGKVDCNSVEEVYYCGNIRAIDSFVNKVKEVCKSNAIGVDTKYKEILYGGKDGIWHNLIDDVTEQLKRGLNNE